MRKTIESGLQQLGCNSNKNAAQALTKYGALLLAQNKVMNLTAITDPIQVAQLHFLDSAALLSAASFTGKRVIDVGTGAGFPGVPLKILEPSIQLTLLDSLGKRVNWLSEVCEELGLDHVECLHARAEEQAMEPNYRDSFDLAVSRAVASLSTLCELCLPFVRVGGCFLAMKAVDSDEELSQAAKGIELLGGKIMKPYDYTIPGTDVSHRVIPIEKIHETPKGYPRKWNKMVKAPL